MLYVLKIFQKMLKMIVFFYGFENASTHPENFLFKKIKKIAKILYIKKYIKKSFIISLTN